MQNKKIVAIYTRVSTLQQVEEGFSLETQKERLLKLCEVNNYKVYKIYEELGKSGKNTNRPAFKQLMKDMKEKKFTKIIVMKLDRISRSVADLENIIKELQENECGFESASEKIDTTSAMGLMFIRLLGIFAQFERERISERIKDVFAEKVQHGGALTGNLPLGYKLGLNEKKEKIVVKDLTKETFILDLFNKYEKTSSLIKTVIYLNNTYPNLVYKGGFTTTDLKRIMKNPIYYGYFKGNNNYCEPYLTYERWKYINNLRENKNIKSKKIYTYLFSGIIKGSCNHKFSGYSFKSKNKENITYSYRCTKYAHTGCCHNYSILEKNIEKRILEMLPDFLIDSLKHTKVEYQKINFPNKDNNLLKNLELTKKRVINSYNHGWLSEDEAKVEINNIEDKIKELSNITNKEKITNLEKNINLDWKSIYQNLNRENKQLLFRSFIDEIIVDIDKYKNKENDFLSIKLL